MFKTGPDPLSLRPPEGGKTGRAQLPGLISVVIPCYNEAKVLARTLNHLRPWRSSCHLEIIVSDDGSSDDSRAIARRLADELVTNPGEPRGSAGARNRGAARAGGDLLVFLDADILVHRPARFFAGVRRRFCHPRLAGATAACQVYPWEATAADNLFHCLYNPYLRLLNLMGIPIASGWCQILRPEVFAAVGGYDRRFFTGQDVDLFLRLRPFGRTRLFAGLTVFESPRRYRKTGLARLILQWFGNGLAVVLLRRPYLATYRVVR